MGVHDLCCSKKEPWGWGKLYERCKHFDSAFNLGKF